MAQGRSGVLRTSCSGLGTQATPKASLQQLKKTRMAVSQSKLQLKIKKCLLQLTAIFADTPSIFFQLLPFRFCHVLCARTFSIPSCLSHYKLTSQLVLARSTAAFIFCGR